MALILADLVQETTNTTGTGTLTLAGAVSGFQSFAAIGNANTTYYRIKSGTDSEVGIGTYTASGTTLSRDTVLYSSAGGTTKITVAAGAFVICTYPAKKSVALDNLGNLSLVGNINLPNGTAAAPALAFTSATTTGLYAATGLIGLAQGGLPLLTGTSGTSYLNITNLSTSLVLAAKGTAASVPLSLQPKNLGDISLGIGNGLSSTQSVRIGGSNLRNGLSTDVSIVSIGNGNQDTATNSVCIGSTNNDDGFGPVANGPYSLAIGTYNQSGGSYSVCIGTNCISSAPDAVAIGYTSTASGTDSVAIGVGSLASGIKSMSLSGSALADNSISIGQSSTANEPFKIALSAGQAAVGQRGLYNLSGTSGGLGTSVKLNYPSSLTTYSIKAPTNSIKSFKGQIIAKDTIATGYAGFEISGMFVNTTGTVSIIGTPTKTLLGASGTLVLATVANITIAVVAGLGISITVTDTAASGATLWHSTIDTTEVGV